MARIGFIGLGNMGLPMAQNLIKAGHQVEGVDVNAAAVEKLKAPAAPASRRPRARPRAPTSSSPCCRPAQQVREVYLGSAGIIANANARHAADRLLDHRCRDRARGRRRGGEERPHDARRAGVGRRRRRARPARSPSWSAARRRPLRARSPILEKMGKTIVHAGGAGNGQAAKICNNMILGISMIAVSEGFVLAEKLGLDHQKLFDIASKSSGQCWAMTSYCPVPGPVPTSPANRDYQPGFTAAMMLKDLKLAQDAAKAIGRQHRARRGGGKHLFTLCRERGGGPRFFRDHSARARIMSRRASVADAR